MEDKTAPEKKSNNMLIIVVGVIVALIVICLICSGIWYFFVRAADEAVDKVTDKAMEEGIENMVEEGIEQGSGGNTDFEFSGDLAAGFPDDVNIYPDSKTVYSYSNEEEGYVANFSVEGVDGGTVMDYYLEELPSAGWDITEQANLFGTMLVAEKGSRTLTLSVVSLEDNMVTYTVTVVNE